MSQRSHCLLIKLDPLQLIVPRILVAEVVDLEGVEFSSTLNRHIRILAWRGFQVPVINTSIFSAACQDVIADDSKLIILHGVLNRSKLPYYAFISPKNPRLVGVSSETLMEDTETEMPRGQGLLMQVQTEGETALIPRVDYVEKYIHSSFFGA
jgi:hypothetical protein